MRPMMLIAELDSDDSHAAIYWADESAVRVRPAGPGRVRSSGGRDRWAVDCYTPRPGPWRDIGDRVLLGVGGLSCSYHETREDAAAAAARFAARLLDMSTYETRGVLAGAYRGRDIADRVLLTHTIAEGADRSLCRKVADEHLADSHSAPDCNDKPPTCPTCLARDPRFAPVPVPLLRFGGFR